MSSAPMRFPYAISLLAGILGAQARDDAAPAELTWKGKDLPRAEVAADDAGLAGVLEAWAPFADANGYRLVLDDDRRVLLVLSGSHERLKSGKENNAVKNYVELAGKTDAVCDGYLGAAEAGQAPLVLVCTRTVDYGKLLAHLRKLHPDLAGWLDGAGRSVAGFVLSEPLVAAWIEDPEGVTEWHPYNELVHRLAQLRVRRQATFLPDWLLLGLAWHTEEAVRRSVYCFPHRRGFVSAASHTDWGLWLANSFKARSRKKAGKPADLELSEFAGWRPGGDDGFDSGKAYLSFGVARYLASKHAEALRSLMHELCAATEKGRKVWLSDTEWKTDPEYAVPVEDQAKLLAAVDGDLMAEVSDWFRKKKANDRVAIGDHGR
ncbi:MAG: hypothetical protein R3F30_14195 [Planctomycetota bacterium]